MRSTCTTKKRRQLVQVEWKWCNGVSRDNLKHKLYKTCNLWKEAPLPSLYKIMCFFARTISKCHFPSKLPSGSPKTRTFFVPKLWMLISFSNQVYFGNARAISLALKKIFPKMYSTPHSELILPLLSRGLWSRVQFPI